MKKRSKNVQLVLDILEDEIKGDVASALEKVTNDYQMIWVYKGRDGALFPKTGKDIRKELEEVYPIKGRKYDIKNIAEGDDVVMVEMVESYPDPTTKKVYRTPLVIVIEMKKGKIAKGRHYCDPDLSYLYLTEEEINKAYE
jgi:ketosteroid isomerase-like protein